MANREETLYVRVTKDEKKAMEARALSCGLTITSWARSVLMFVSTGEGPPPGFPAGANVADLLNKTPLALEATPKKSNGKNWTPKDFKAAAKRARR
jgi:hypothetical protein